MGLRYTPDPRPPIGAPVRSRPVVVIVVLFIVCMAVAVISIASLSIQRGRRLLPLWVAAAHDLGVSPPPPMGGTPRLAIAGSVEEWHLSIAEGTHDDETIISYELEGLERLPLGFTVKAEHRASQMPVVGKLFSGGQAQVDTGDPRFDQEFIIVGQDPDEVREFLTEERRRALLGLAESCPKFRLTRGDLTYRFTGGTEKIDDLARPAHAMIDAARALTAAGESVPPVGEVFPGPGDAPAEPATAQAEEPVALASDAGETSPPSPAGVVFPAPDPAVEAATDDQLPHSG